MSNMGRLILTTIPACSALNLLQQQKNAGKHHRNPKKDSISFLKDLKYEFEKL